MELNETGRNSTGISATTLGSFQVFRENRYAVCYVNRLTYIQDFLYVIFTIKNLEAYCFVMFTSNKLNDYRYFPDRKRALMINDKRIFKTQRDTQVHGTYTAMQFT